MPHIASGLSQIWIAVAYRGGGEIAAGAQVLPIVQSGGDHVPVPCDSQAREREARRA